MKTTTRTKKFTTHKERCETLDTALRNWGLSKFDSHVLAGVISSTPLSDSEIVDVAKSLTLSEGSDREQAYRYLRSKG